MIRIYLTGRIGVEADEQLVIEERHFRGKQSRLMFAYLVSERHRPVLREDLAKLIWGDELAQTWELSLSSLISRIRRLLIKDALDQAASLSGRFGQYELRLPPASWVDLEACGGAVDRAEGALRNGDPQGVLSPATVALNISRRPFLSGIEGEWVESQRRKLERVRLRALDSLSRMWLAKPIVSLSPEASSTFRGGNNSATRSPP